MPITQFNDSLINYQSESDLILQLRKDPYLLTMREIAQFIGKSRQHVHNVLTELEEAGRLPIFIPEEMKNKNTYIHLSDEEISDSFDVSLNLVITTRKSLGILREVNAPWDIETRNARFVKMVWGDEYLPGSQFSNKLPKLLDYVTNKSHREALQEYYLDQVVKTPNNARVKRHRGIKYLKNFEHENKLTEKRLKEGVIIYGESI